MISKGRAPFGATHWAFHAIRRVVRIIPDNLPGKFRLARLSLRPFRSLAGVRIPDRYGNELWCPNLEEPMALGLFAQGAYEPGTIDSILSQLEGGGTFVDVGSNIGAIALPIAARRPSARVICVEADPEIAELLRANVSTNSLPNVTIIECIAGGEAASAVSFYRAPPNKFGMGSVAPRFNGAVLDLKQRTLDEVCDELGVTTIDVLKIDVEGSELGVLRGAERRLKSPEAPWIIFEFNDWAEAGIPGQSPGAAQAYLISLGFSLFELDRKGHPCASLKEPLRAGGAMILAVRT